MNNILIVISTPLFHKVMKPINPVWKIHFNFNKATQEASKSLCKLNGLCKLNFPFFISHFHFHFDSEMLPYYPCILDFLPTFQDCIFIKYVKGTFTEPHSVWKISLGLWSILPYFQSAWSCSLKRMYSQLVYRLPSDHRFPLKLFCSPSMSLHYISLNKQRKPKMVIIIILLC